MWGFRSLNAVAIRLCSRTQIVCIAVRPTWTLTLTSPARKQWYSFSSLDGSLLQSMGRLFSLKGSRPLPVEPGRPTLSRPWPVKFLRILDSPSVEP